MTFGLPTVRSTPIGSVQAICYRFRYRFGGTAMSYALKKRNQWYAVGYERLDPLTDSLSAIACLDDPL